MTRRRRKEWDYYRKGQTIRDAGVKILEVITQGTTKETTCYRVRMLCYSTHPEGYIALSADPADLNGRQRMSHARIDERVRKGRKHCFSCATRNRKGIPLVGRPRRQEETPVLYRHWDAPPTALNLPLGWMPR